MAIDADNSISIGQMTPASAITGSAIVPVVIAGRNFRTTAQAFANLVTKESLDLDNVQNLAPFEMPVSVAQKAALDKKLDALTGVIEITQVNGLRAELDDRYSRNELIPISGINMLEQRLQELQLMSIDASRVDNLASVINATIDGRQDLKQSVMQGSHTW